MGEQSADYAKGYAAGKRYADRDQRNQERRHQKHMARYALAAALAPTIAQNPWQQNGKMLNTAKGVAETICDIVLAVEDRLG